MMMMMMMMQTGTPGACPATETGKLQGTCGMFRLLGITHGWCGLLAAAVVLPRHDSEGDGCGVDMRALRLRWPALFATDVRATTWSRRPAREAAGSERVVAGRSVLVFVCRSGTGRDARTSMIACLTLKRCRWCVTVPSSPDLRNHECAAFSICSLVDPGTGSKNTEASGTI